MATAIRETTSTPNQAVSIAEQRVVLRGISWDTYERMGNESQTANVHITYDRGDLELMSPSPFHDRCAHLFQLLIGVYAEENEISVCGYRTTTFRDVKLRQGLEPDNCYYVQHADTMEGKSEIDLNVDPPPDLAIEIDLTHPTVSKLPIYAALGVPELWLYDRDSLVVMTLNANRTYVSTEGSKAFPKLSLANFVKFLKVGEQLNDTSVVRQYRQSLRQQPG